MSSLCIDGCLQPCKSADKLIYGGFRLQPAGSGYRAGALPPPSADAALGRYVPLSGSCASRLSICSPVAHPPRSQPPRTAAAKIFSHHSPRQSPPRERRISARTAKREGAVAPLGALPASLAALPAEERRAARTSGPARCSTSALKYRSPSAPPARSQANWHADQRKESPGQADCTFEDPAPGTRRMTAAGRPPHLTIAEKVAAAISGRRRQFHRPTGGGTRRVPRGGGFPSTPKVSRCGLRPGGERGASRCYVLRGCAAPHIAD